MLINVMFVVLMFGFSIFPRAFVCEYFFCPFELLFALSRKEIKALSFFSIEFTIFQEFSVRLGSEMSFVTKWRLWSRKLYLLFPLKITLVSLAHPFLSLPFFIMEKLLREKNVISFLVAAICIEIFYWFHIAYQPSRGFLFLNCVGVCESALCVKILFCFLLNITNPLKVDDMKSCTIGQHTNTWVQLVFLVLESIILEPICTILPNQAI